MAQQHEVFIVNPNLSVIGKEFLETMEIQGTVYNLLDKDYSVLYLFPLVTTYHVQAEHSLLDLVTSFNLKKALLFPHTKPLKHKSPFSWGQVLFVKNIFAENVKIIVIRYYTIHRENSTIRPLFFRVIMTYGKECGFTPSYPVQHRRSIVWKHGNNAAGYSSANSVWTDTTAAQRSLRAVCAMTDLR